MTAANPNAASPATPEAEAPAVESHAELPSPEFDRVQWDESRADEGPATPGGRKVLAIALIALAIAWTAFAAWSAGATIGEGAVPAAAIAQWMAIAAGPLALLGLGWLMFGRTRRREAERFTQSVVTMRTEARSLEALLQVLSRRIENSRSELATISTQLVDLGDQTTGKLDGITSAFDSSTQKLARHGEALDRAAEQARTDIAVLLDDLPRAEGHARSISEVLRSAASETAERTGALDRQVGELTEASRKADETVTAAAQRLVEQLARIESAGATAAERVGEAETAFDSTVDGLLDRASEALDQIRNGIDTQSQAVNALVEQASAGIGRAGVDSAEALAGHVAAANGAIDTLAARVAEQERASLHMAEQIDSALAELVRRFEELAQTGDERATSFIAVLGQSRTELEAVGESSEAQRQSLDSLAERTEALQQVVERLAGNIRGQLGQAISEASGEADHLVTSARSVRPEIEWMRDAAKEASERIESTGSAIVEQQDRLAALLGTMDDGLSGADGQIAALAAAIADAEAQAAQFKAETGPALIDAMVQIREAAGHAAQRAREAIDSVVPESAERLGDATRQALEDVIRESVEQRLREVEIVAARAVQSARSATDRLTNQMLVLGQSATALEQHMEKQQEERLEADSEAVARRVSLLIDSMHSASIDVGKILSDEVDEKAWDAYLKGDRGVFTRRAARLIGSSENKAIRAHYETDGEFHQSVNRYVHDFEAMLRRLLAERDGGLIAVTLMSSDMGKLYAALSDAIDRRR